MTEKNIHILLVDDNLNEHFFFKHALAQVARPVRFDALEGGVELVEHFKDEQNPLPDILFLDINMPLKNGKECLSLLRADERFDIVPIVMYSTSDAQRDIDETYALGADLYVRKPNGMDALRSMISSVIFIYDKNELKRSAKENFLLTA
jgi:CheY-like chemotaxis protein